MLVVGPLFEKYCCTELLNIFFVKMNDFGIFYAIIYLLYLGGQILMAHRHTILQIYLPMYAANIVCCRSISEYP